MSEAYIGISGWTYAPWRGVFYPSRWPRRRELEYCCAHFNSLEINGSFYSLQTPDRYRDWYRQAPAGFRYAVKGGRFITHMKRLRDPALALANFFASGVLLLADKLGPILWQLPPDLAFDPQRMAGFLDLLPGDGVAAAALAARHDQRVAGRAWLRAAGVGQVRHALEIRHPSFLQPEALELLRRHRVALVLADSAGQWPYTEDLTADFVYVRLHGAEQLYASGYSDAQLDWWAARLTAWRDGGEPADARRLLPASAPRPGRELFVYFDNDAKVQAPFDAQRLAARLGTGRISCPAPPAAGAAIRGSSPSPGRPPRRR